MPSLRRDFQNPVAPVAGEERVAQTWRSCRGRSRAGCGRCSRTGRRTAPPASGVPARYSASRSSIQRDADVESRAVVFGLRHHERLERREVVRKAHHAVADAARQQNLALEKVDGQRQLRRGQDLLADAGVGCPARKGSRRAVRGKRGTGRPVRCTLRDREAARASRGSSSLEKKLESVSFNAERHCVRMTETNTSRLGRIEGSAEHCLSCIRASDFFRRSDFVLKLHHPSI